MAIRVEEKSDNEMIIVLDERFDFGSVEQFRRSYEGIGNSKRFHIDIDFSSTRYIDSSALGMLINAKNYLSQADTKIRIVNVNDQIRKIFSISRFETKFEII